MGERLKRGKSVLVTGGAGFIGSHLVERLVAEGIAVTVVDDLSNGSLENLSQAASQIRIERSELGSLITAGNLDLEFFDFVFHLSANAYVPPSVSNPRYDFHTTLANTFYLLDAMRACSRPPFLVYMSSAAVYGNPVNLPVSESDLTVPVSPYGVSKLAGERYVEVFCKLYNLKGASLRLFSAYGPRQRKQVVFDLLMKLKASGGSIEVAGDGSQLRDFLYVGDVVEAMMLIAEKSRGEGEVYNVASGETHSINDLVNFWCELCSFTPQVSYSGKVRSGDAEKWAADISRLEELGYKAQVGFKQGLKATLDWYDSSMNSSSQSVLT